MFMFNLRFLSYVNCVDAICMYANKYKLGFAKLFKTHSIVHSTPLRINFVKFCKRYVFWFSMSVTRSLSDTHDIENRMLEILNDEETDPEVKQKRISKLVR